MDIKQMMKRHGIRPKKRLGQHFLIDETPIFKMIDAAELNKNDTVLEIGPGLGVMTRHLCEKAGRVFAVEKDEKMIPILVELTRDFKNVCIINGDVLKLNLDNIKHKTTDKYLKVVANLPYYITSPIIMNIIQNRNLFNVAVLMVQKEVGDRIVALPGGKEYGILSIAVQLYCDVNIICPVGKMSFMPPPKVDSSVIKLEIRKEPKVLLEDESLFFAVVKAAFGERRKIIKNTLKNRLKVKGIQSDDIERALENARIHPGRRAETLSLTEFARITMQLASLNNIDKRS
ncbi:MAG: 16S rRNA (adenine(1518)-N(6)/adenine(1519)-N(6))-dimethyltransferase RsmA [Tepidanaerobacteraceae bacterium]